MQKVMAYLRSKKTGEEQGDKEEVTLIRRSTTGSTTIYMVITEIGIKCSAIFNPFSCSYYADDIYGIIRED